MIHVIFYKKDDGTVHMDMQGHSTSAPKGENLICAAATTLAYTLGQSLQFLYENNRLMEKPSIQLVIGYAHISAKPKEMYFWDVLMTFWVVQSGIFCLYRNFPKEFSLTTMDISND